MTAPTQRRLFTAVRWDCDALIGWTRTSLKIRCWRSSIGAVNWSNAIRNHEVTQHRLFTAVRWDCDGLIG